MVDYKKLVPYILKWEGGLVNDPIDRGGLTNKGITFETYTALAQRVLGIAPTQANFRAMTKEQASLFVKYFFDIATGGNTVRSEQIAFILTNWHWGSGKGGLISFQKMLNQKFGAGLKEDGVIGPKTVAVINSINSSKLYNEAIKWRADFFRAIAKNDPSQNRFLKGWLNRLNDFVKLHPAPIAISTTLIIGLGLLFFLTNRS
jgi:lysozyme family protein